jgi:uncharacterized protein involved in type VI secretion and phage assembly
VRASSAARPSHPCVRGRGACRSVRCGARLRRKGEEDERRETDERALLVSEKEEKEKAPVAGCLARSACLACWAGGFA